jgi:hypothetical protein
MQAIATRRGSRRWLWIGTVMGWALLVAYGLTIRGHLDFAYHAVGRDFINIWIAGRLVVEGRALETFDPRQFLAAAHALYDPALPFHFWSYPPTALCFAAPLGALGYFMALAVWSVVGLVVLGLAARRFLPASDLHRGGQRALVRRVYQRAAPADLKAGVLIVATLLATPQSFNYDMIPVSAAVLVLGRYTVGTGGPSTRLRGVGAPGDHDHDEFPACSARARISCVPCAAPVAISRAGRRDRVTPVPARRRDEPVVLHGSDWFEAGAFTRSPTSKA